MPTLVKLEKWGLIEAYLGKKIVELDKYALLVNSRSVREIRFFLSPNAAAIEEDLGLNLSGLFAPIFGRPRPGKWPDVFVLMPFAADFNPLFVDHLKKVVVQAGLTIGRADDFFSTGAIVNDIWSAIYHARILIAECTGRNPNVFYETGIAHTIGRETILLAQSMNDIPFDLRHLRVIVYEFTPRGVEKLEDALERTIWQSIHATRMSRPIRPMKEMARKRRSKK